MAIRLLASSGALFYKHHMLNEMFMIDKWMVRIDSYSSLFARRSSWGLDAVLFQLLFCFI